MSQPDPRTTPMRPDLAAESLRGLVAAPRYAAPRRMSVADYAVGLRRAPRRDAALDTEALFGEAVDVYDIDEDGWAWVQLAGDGYVGYVPVDDLREVQGVASHRVAVPRTFIYPVPDIKAPPQGALPMAAQVSAHAAVAEAKTAAAGAAAACFIRLASGGFVYAAHLAPVGEVSGDPAAVAAQFVGAPYLWGGRTSLGLDCSALVQLSLMSVGQACPRDSDMQQRDLGQALAPDAFAALRRGDLVFWRGHVGMMLDTHTLVHANGHHMQVAAEPLDGAMARIEAAGGGPVTALRSIAFVGEADAASR